MDLVFYAGDQFPADYRGNVFAVLKGSWNRVGTDRLQGRPRAV